MAFMRSPVRPRLAPPAFAEATAWRASKGRKFKININTKMGKNVRKENIKNIIYLFIPVILLSILFFSFYYNHDLKTSIISTFITWSFYILCIPAFHGKLVIGLPYKIITGKTLKYPELIMWSIAAIFTTSSLFFLKDIFFSSIINHLFYIILTNPWPYLVAISVATFGTFYRFTIGYNHFFDNKILHYILRTIVIVCSIFILIYLSYNELIILMNLSV